VSVAVPSLIVYVNVASPATSAAGGERDRGAGERDRATDRVADRGDGERVAVDVGVVGEQGRGRDHLRLILDRGADVGDRDRRVVDGGHGDPEGRAGGEPPGGGGDGEGLGAGGVGGRGVGDHQPVDRHRAARGRRDRERHRVAVGIRRGEGHRDRRFLGGRRGGVVDGGRAIVRRRRVPTAHDQRHRERPQGPPGAGPSTGESEHP
jgi:hypothetical protein